MKKNGKKILLIDTPDLRRQTRINILANAGYRVEVRDGYLAAKALGDENEFDIVVLSLADHPEKALEYSDQMSKANPSLPILLLADVGVFIPRGTMNRSLSSGNPAALVETLACISTGNTMFANYSSSLPNEARLRTSDD